MHMKKVRFLRFRQKEDLKIKEIRCKCKKIKKEEVELL